jgi:hypothetical protein
MIANVFFVQAEGVEIESAGGSVQLVRTSAPSGTGLLELEEALLLQVHTCLPIACIRSNSHLQTRRQSR